MVTRAPAKKLVTFRIAEKGLLWIDGFRTEDVDRSDVIRTALAVAARHEDEMEREIGRR